VADARATIRVRLESGLLPIVEERLRSQERLTLEVDNHTYSGIPVAYDLGVLNESFELISGTRLAGFPRVEMVWPSRSRLLLLAPLRSMWL
jgi:hypothetical protein